MRVCSRLGFVLYHPTLRDTLGHRHWRSSTKMQGKTWEMIGTCIFQNSVCTAPNRSETGDAGETSRLGLPLVKANLATKGRRGMESTFSSEGALSYAGKTAEIEKLWQEFFSDPTEWWDNRSDKPNQRFPDFVHKKTAQGLWMDSKCIPLWVEAKLAALPPGVMELSNFSWNQSLSRYAQAGQFERTMDLFQQMQREGKTADRFTFPPVLKSCANLGLLEHGRRIHTMMPPGFEANVFIGSSLVDMYAKCGSIEEAERVFNRMSTRDVVVWNAMIRGYVKCREGHKALGLFEQMQQQGVAPDPLTFVGLLNACASVAALEGGRCVHEEIIRRGYEAEGFVGNSLVDMYAKCGSIEEAERVFNRMPTRDLGSWNAMILGYEKCGEGQKALELFDQMRRQDVDVNHVTFLGVLNACATIATLQGGRCVHEEIIRRGYESNSFVGSSLIDMYAKCGSIKEAERVFNEMPTRDVVAWTTMIGGYAKCGEGQKALELFEQMQQQEVAPDPVTFVGVLNACANVATLEGGRHAHEEIIRRGYETNIFVGNCLVDMYAKCGSIVEAERVFNRMPKRDLVGWNAMMGGYVRTGEGQKALELFEQMQQQEVAPNPVTYVVVLNACASVAALEGGRHAHEEIICRGYEADLFVANSLIDMYAKCGSIEEAERVFNQMPTRDLVSWSAMLGGYGIHGHARKALETFKHMSKIVEVDAVTFTSLLSACSHGGLVTEGLEIFKSMGAVYSVTPTVEHFACVVDLLGRAGRLREAEDLIMRMPMDPDAAVWMALLSACQAHVNVEVGERCAKRVLELNPDFAAARILLSNIYVAAGKFDSIARLSQERLCRGVKRISGRTWIEVNNKVHSFVGNADLHPKILEIRAELERLCHKMKDCGYVPDTRFLSDTRLLQCVSKEERELCLCHHGENLAIAFGLISTAPGTPLRIVKNLQMCSVSHTTTKFIAKTVEREITVRDANRFHHFEDGLCSCRDY